MQVLPLPQTQLIIKQLSILEDQLYKLLASYRFYDYTVLHLAQPEDAGNSEAEHFAFGVFLYQQQLHQQAKQAMATLNTLQRTIS